MNRIDRCVRESAYLCLIFADDYHINQFELWTAIWHSIRKGYKRVNE